MRCIRAYVSPPKITVSAGEPGLLAASPAQASIWMSYGHALAATQRIGENPRSAVFAIEGRTPRHVGSGFSQIDGHVVSKRRRRMAVCLFSATSTSRPNHDCRNILSAAASTHEAHLPGDCGVIAASPGSYRWSHFDRGRGARLRPTRSRTGAGR